MRRISTKSKNLLLPKSEKSKKKKNKDQKDENKEEDDDEKRIKQVFQENLDSDNAKSCALNLISGPSGASSDDFRCPDFNKNRREIRNSPSLSSTKVDQDRNFTRKSSQEFIASYVLSINVYKRSIFVELLLSGPNSKIQTLPNLRRQRPQARISDVIMVYSFCSYKLIFFSTWKQAQILKLCHQNLKKMMRELFGRNRIGSIE